MARFSELFVIWREPSDDGSRHLIGRLWRTSDRTYAFAYRSDLTAGLARGFCPLTEFPALERTSSSPYESPYLFATFAQRVPTTARPDFRKMIQEWGVENPDDPLEILARSGGVQLTDRLELAEYRDDDDPLSEPLEFRIAGSPRYEAIARLKIGDRLRLERDTPNPYDPNASWVLNLQDERLGHVPRQYAKLIAAHIDRSHDLDAQAIRRISWPAEPERWVVRVRLLPVD